MRRASKAVMSAPAATSTTRATRARRRASMQRRTASEVLAVNLRRQTFDEGLHRGELGMDLERPAVRGERPALVFGRHEDMTEAGPRPEMARLPVEDAAEIRHGVDGILQKEEHVRAPVPCLRPVGLQRE